MERNVPSKSTNMYVVRGRKALNMDKKSKIANQERISRRADGDRIDERFGFVRLTEGSPRTGWLLNYISTTMIDESGRERAGLELYFVQNTGENFKASITYDPYFFVDIPPAQSSRLNEVVNHLSRRFEGCRATIVSKDDLDQANHLAPGVKHQFIKIAFDTVNALVEAKTEIKTLLDRRDSRSLVLISEQDEGPMGSRNKNGGNSAGDPLDCIVGIREYDVPYTMRVAIDLDIRVGAWYLVTPTGEGSETCQVEWLKEMLELCEPRMLAFDIECEKSPLKFPNAERDRIFMISYMTKGQGYLIINREIVSEDVDDFEYTPKPSFPGPFKVINVANEEVVLRTFINHVQELRPHIIVTYNGDRFDWPYVEARCDKYSGLSLYQNLGIRVNKSGGESSPDTEYVGRCMVHLDAFSWVQRDSYLPQGNQGLKAVTKCKLGYDPVEVDPEDMLRFARERPHHMASYSVSDAVATFYLYTTYVHNFIFSLSTIIPMGPEDVLRKGSGTLCEALLMVEAYKGNIICPNKQVDPLESYHNGRLLESETYIGGHVECLEAGVFRADIPVLFDLTPSALQQLIDHIDRDIAFAMEVEYGTPRSEATNYEEVKQSIVEKLEMLRDSPRREELPVIYHLDVGAMYPNIILTNRLQPSSMVTTADCAACKYNQSSNHCKRPMTWTWRGEYSPASFNEYNAIKKQLSYEKTISNTGESKTFLDLSPKEQAAHAKARLKAYSQRVYKKGKVTEVQERVSTVCMRENSFYVDTVKAFRDRRYDYKLLTKTWKNKKIEAEKKGDRLARKAAEDREILMDSLQLAHKCILNSFYGYVMRKGARWRSMEMAGIVTHTGAQLIRQARELVEQVGRPLELDTDGIWCILPASFPKEYKIRLRSGKSVSLNYPCAMLNADVHERYTNHQYQVLDKTHSRPHYATHAECSIFFELDGPYKAMILPASPEEGRLLKKKYVVFNFDGSLAELKGFEVKRRGELELVKIFQSQVFEQFLAGKSLQECYDAVAAVGNQWLDVLDEEGRSMNDEELLELISERKTISKTVEDYDGRKSTSLTTAGRLADFLGAEMVQDKGLNCNLIISRLPAGAPVTDRAIPVAIFSCDHNIRRYFLRKWLKDSSLDCVDFRDVVDWSYYKERLGKTIQKIITIPAGMQRISNPCPRVEHPPWLQKQLAMRSDRSKQLTIQDIFKPRNPALYTITSGKEQPCVAIPPNHSPSSGNKNNGKRSADSTVDIEDMTTLSPAQITPTRAVFATDVNASVEATSEGHSEAQPVVARPFLDNVPANSDELQSWLASRKEKWRKFRSARKTQVASDKTQSWISSLKTKRPTGVIDFVRQANFAASHGIWQIVEIQEIHDSPGDFQVWAFTSPMELHKLVLNIPRILYVNVLPYSSEGQQAAEHLGGQKVRRDLPHGKDCLELYEIQLPERRYQRNDKSINLFLASTEVEGVYESQLPLWFRAVLQIGCVSRAAGNRKRDGLRNAVYQLSDVEMVHTHSVDYLTAAHAQFKRIFIYFAQDRARQTNAAAVLSIFFLQSSNDNKSNISSSEEEKESEDLSARCYVWLITGRGSGSSTLESKPPCQRIFQKFRAYHRGEVKFSTSFVGTLDDALRAANEKVEDYHRQRPGPTIVVAQGGNHGPVASLNTSLAMSQREWRQFLPALHDFPLAVMPANTLDELFPAVGWPLFAAERMIQRYQIHFRWFKDRLRCASYAQIPICNLTNDAPTTILDVAFGRLLQTSRHLLWASGRPNNPDLGQGAALHQDLWQIWAEPLQEPRVNNPGVYRSACIELDLYGLAVCAIIVSSDLDADGLLFSSNGTTTNGSGGMFDNKAPVLATSILGSESSCGKAFNVLKALVMRCVEEVRRGDHLADKLLTAIYRYLCGYGNGLLSDPLLHRVIYTLMCRLFWKLMRSLRELGVQIVFADFNRIIIATNRKTIAEAEEYVAFILEAVGNQEVFGYLQITKKQRWEQLLWLESENFTALSFASDVVHATEENDNVMTDVDNEKEDDEAHEHKEGHNPSGKHEEEEEHEMLGEEVSHQSHGSFNLAEIKKSIAMAQTSRSRYFEDGDDEGLSDPSVSEEELDDEDADENDVAFRRTNEMRKYGSINELLDSFEENNYDQPLTILGKRHEEPKEEEEEDLVDPRILQQWSLASNWSEAAVIYFQFIVGEFLYQYESVIQPILNQQIGEHDPAKAFLSSNPDAPLPSLGHALEEEEEEALEARAQEQVTIYIESSLTPHMLEVVDELCQIHLAENARSQALDLVKAVCHLLSLEKSSAVAVRDMRRLLLVQLQVPEFSQDSEFHLQEDSYVLRDVICSYCSMCRDFDLLRDRSLLQRRSLEEAWKCPYCQSAINMEEVEIRLLQVCDQLLSRFLLQDFRCPKTNQVGQRLCATQSNLCLDYMMDYTVEEAKKDFKALRDVAILHHFPDLLQAVQDILGQEQ
eukprot:gene441-475_t